jgi:glutathione S-transferase
MDRVKRISGHLGAATAAKESGGVTFYTLDEVGSPDPEGGLRITMLPGLPGLWAECLKNLCDVKKVDYIRAIHPFGDKQAQESLYKLTAQRSLPTMLYNDDPPRSAMIEQINLAENLGAPDAPKLIPAETQDRILMFGLLNELAGEGGIVYTVRLMGGPNSPLAVKYGYTPEVAAAGGQKIADGLTALSKQLEAQKLKGSKYFVGSSISVLDVYWATMSLMFAVPDEEIMPRTKQNKGLLAGFAATGALFAGAGALSLSLLIEHREYIYRNYLVTPAVIGGTPL